MLRPRTRFLQLLVLLAAPSRPAPRWRLATRTPPAPVDAGPAAMLAPQGPHRGEEAAAPARPLHPPGAALPDLPSLTAHEAPAQPPPDADLGDHPCKAVWTGSEAAPLACARSLLFGAGSVDGGINGDGATLLVPRSLLARDPAVLPAVSDHRVEGTEGAVRNQGDAPVCTAFLPATPATAADHALARWSSA